MSTGLWCAQGTDQPGPATDQSLTFCFPTVGTWVFGAQGTDSPGPSRRVQCDDVIDDVIIQCDDVITFGILAPQLLHRKYHHKPLYNYYNNAQTFSCLLYMFQIYYII